MTQRHQLAPAVRSWAGARDQPAPHSTLSKFWCQRSDFERCNALGLLAELPGSSLMERCAVSRCLVQCSAYTSCDTFKVPAV